MTIVAGPKVVEDGLVLSYDFANKKSFSANVHPGSTNIYDWYVGIRGNAGANQSTLSKDTIESPVGNTPLRMDVTGSDPHISSYNGLQWNLDEATSGDTWTVSVYAKASTNTTCQIYIFGANSSGQYIEAPSGARNITTEWQRISFTHTFANSNTVYIQSRLDGPDTQAGGNAVGQTIWFDGWQVERGSTATKFSPFYSDGNILDLSGKGNVGNLVNAPAFSEDNYGALVFDGTNDTINFEYDLRSNWTYECWVNKNSKDNFSFLGQGITSSRSGLHINMYSDRLRFGMYSNDTDALGLYSNTSTGVWYHYAFTYNHSTFLKEIYRNGVQLTGTPAQTQTAYIGTGTVRIGAQYSSGSTYANGKMASSKLYNRVLTPIEIKQNFEATRGRFGI